MIASIARSFAVRTSVALGMVWLSSGCDDSSKTAPAPAATASASAATLASANPPAARTPEAPSEAPTSAPTTPPLDPAAYDIDGSHSRVGFSVRHMMVSTVRGEFKKFTGTAFIDEKNPPASKISLEADVASIDTSEPKRDAHLKSPDFFDAAKFPKLAFASTSVARSTTGYSVKGDLTIHGVTKPVTLDVEALSPEMKDPWGGLRRGTHARAKIDRKDFGLTWNKALETGGAVVGDDVTIDLDVELLKQQSKK
jgi:polyisoprenoid-binding protein YceI